MEHIVKDQNGKILGYLSNINDAPNGLNFFGVSDDFIQVATFKYEYGHRMNNHTHIPRTPPSWFMTHEVLVVWKGIVELRVFDDFHDLICTQIMEAGDFYINVGGGVRIYNLRRRHDNARSKNRTISRIRP